MNMYEPGEWDWLEQASGARVDEALFESGEKGIVFSPINGGDVTLTKSELQRIIDQLNENP